MLHANHLAFLVMSMIWGSTWIASKVMVETVPPNFFSGVRFALVCLCLAPIVATLPRRLPAPLVGRVIASGLLTTSATYMLLFWGLRFLPSGVAGVINLSLMVILLYFCAVAAGQERLSWRPFPALALGIAGLLLLFKEETAAIDRTMQLWGAAAVIGATATYALGSVLAKPLVGRIAALDLTAAHALLGCFTLGGLSLAIDPIDKGSFLALLQPAPLASLLFMVLGGTLLAYTIYLRLVRDWGATKAGLYSFVSPVVALILGWLVMGEPLGWHEIAGAAALLTAAAISLPRAPRITPANAAAPSST